jgi:hypothetical protein
MDSFRADNVASAEYSAGGSSIAAPAGIQFSTASQSVLHDSASPCISPARFANTSSDTVAFNAAEDIHVTVISRAGGNFRDVPTLRSLSSE